MGNRSAVATVIGAIAALSMAVSACGGSNPVQGSQSSTAASDTTTTVAYSAAEQAYLTAAHSNGDDTLGSDAKLIDFAQQLCAEAQVGLIGTNADNNIALTWTLQEAGDKVGRGTAPHTVDLMNQAAKYICPQYQAKIQTEAQADD